MRPAKQKSHGVAAFIADRADNIFSCVHHVFVHADNADIFLSIEEGWFQPADIERDALLQKSLFDQPFTFRIRYLAKFNFIMHFQ